MKWKFYMRSCSKNKSQLVVIRDMSGEEGDIMSVGVGRTKIAATLDGIKHFESIGVRCRGQYRAKLLEYAKTANVWRDSVYGMYYAVLIAVPAASHRATFSYAQSVAFRVFGSSSVL